MDADLKQKAKQIIGFGIAKIVGNYSDNALLINACYVASDRYKTLTGTNGLSTTQGIPDDLRLDQEIDVQYKNEELVERYTDEVLQVILRNYVVVSVSIVDAALEELYELFLKHYEDNISDNDAEKKVRSAWSNDNLISYFEDPDKANLSSPAEFEQGFVESFMRYKELRIVRHTLVHSNGALSERNRQQLLKYQEETPEARKGAALIDSPIIGENGDILLTINIILSIRQYLDRFLTYVYKSLSDA